ncbi:MAG: PDZ domain-containing protein [Flavobacteriales bacterium]
MFKIYSLLSVLISIATLSYAQTQEATIKIEKSENGETVIVQKKIELTDGQDINSILQELGVLDELGNLKEGQSFEINVKKKDGINTDEDIRIEYFDVPELNFGFESKAYLGVMLSNNDEGEGVLIGEVIEDTQAAKAGLNSGDIILSMNGERYDSVDELVSAIGAMNPQDNIVIDFLRGDEILTKSIELGEKKVTPFEQRNFRFQFPEQNMTQDFGRLFEFHLDEEGNTIGAPEMEGDAGFLGVSPGFRCTDEDEGVLIGSVTEGSAAEAMGIQSGDFILGINKAEVNTFDELSTIIRNLKKGDEVKITLNRDGKKLKMKGNLGGRPIMNSFHGMDMFEGLPGENPSFGEPGEREFFFRYDGDENSIPLEGMNEQLEEMMRELESMGDDFDTQEFELQLQEMLTPLLEDMEMTTSEEININITVESISPQDMEFINREASVKLSMEDDLDMQYISFFPNPTSGEFNLKFTLSSEEPYKVLVYNQLGKTVFEDNRNVSGEYDGSIDLSLLSSGPYYLIISQGDSTYNRKIIKE